MAYSAENNQVFFERSKNLAILLQNFREEYARLLEQYNLEVSPSGVDDANYVDVDNIATKVELEALLLDACQQVENVFSNQPVSAGFRGFMLVPFLVNDPQI